MQRLKLVFFILARKLKVYLLYFKRRLVTPPLPKNSNILIHIGCGEINSPEFINIDARPFPHVHVIGENNTDLSMFSDGAADLIYMCHILEHIKRKDLLKVLQEMKRVLKKGGILRLSVPDLDRIIDIYNHAGKDIDSIFTPLMGGQEYEYNFHYSIFNYQYLSELLKRVGFQEIREWDPFNCKFHNFDDYASKKYVLNGKEYIISLNLEAVK